MHLHNDQNNTNITCFDLSPRVTRHMVLQIHMHRAPQQYVGQRAVTVFRENAVKRPSVCEKIMPRHVQRVNECLFMHVHRSVGSLLSHLMVPFIIVEHSRRHKNFYQEVLHLCLIGNFKVAPAQRRYFPTLTVAECAAHAQANEFSMKPTGALSRTGPLFSIPMYN